MDESASTPGGLEAFVEYVRQFLEYTEDDRRCILASATLVLPHSKELLDQIYGKLLELPTTRGFFLGAEGEPNEMFLEKRRKTLFEWFANTASGALDARLAAYVQEVALLHLRRSEPGLRAVPWLDIDLFFGFLEVVLLGHLASAIDDSKELAETLAAWAKMLAAQRVIFSLTYQQPDGPEPARPS